MVLAAKGLPVGWIKVRAAVLSLYDVIGEEAMLWAALAAPPAAFSPLALVAGAAKDFGSPCPMSGGEEFWIGAFGGGL